MGRDRLTLVEIFHVPNKIIKLGMIINTKGKFYILADEYDTSSPSKDIFMSHSHSLVGRQELMW